MRVLIMLLLAVIANGVIFNFGDCSGYFTGLYVIAVCFLVKVVAVKTMCVFGCGSGQVLGFQHLASMLYWYALIYSCISFLFWAGPVVVSALFILAYLFLEYIAEDGDMARSRLSSDE